MHVVSKYKEATVVKNGKIEIRTRRVRKWSELYSTLKILLTTEWMSGSGSGNICYTTYGYATCMQSQACTKFHFPHSFLQQSSIVRIEIASSTELCQIV